MILPRRMLRPKSLRCLCRHDGKPLGVVRIGCKPNLQMVGPGAVLGLAEGLAQTPITFEVSAVSVLEVAEISIVDLERALGHSGKVLQAVARLAMERILHDRAFGGRS